MKVFLSFFLVLIFVEAFGQLTFYGESEPLPAINSGHDESQVALHPAAELMIISRSGHPGAVGEQFNPLDLWISEKDSAWSTPANSMNVDPANAISPLGFVNGGEMFLYGKRITSRGSNASELWVADFDSDRLTNHRKLKIPYLENKSSHFSGSISKDGRHILLSMESTTTFGVEDLYVIHLKSEGSWTAPRNLGYRVNTAFQEYTPFLAADNETLVFATNGRGGEGSFDLFITQRIDDTWQNWTEPQNLGTQVNTKGKEISFIFRDDDEFAYFSSTSDSDGYGDIKQIMIKSDIESTDQEETAFIVQDDEREIKKIFTLKDINSDRIIEGQLNIEGETDGKVKTPYTMVSGEIEDVSIIASAAGYLDFEAVITASDLEAQDLIVIPMKPLDVGTTINLDNVLFYQGTANFIEGSNQELNRVVSMMKDNPNMKILIKGHTDNVGIAALNLELSKERVQTVLDYLTEKGIDSSRLEGKGFGGDEPIAPNDTEANRRLNRRVEFTILEN